MFGATLTLRRDDANLLIAFIALFVTIVGTRAWRICCFGLHQALSSAQPRDGLYHQLQATLRNASNVTSALVTLFQLSWAWRGLAQGWKRRLLPILAFAVLFFAAFALASGFSSRIAANSEALISSPHCGWLDYSLNTNSSDLQSIFIPYTYQDVFTSANYAQQCYASNSTGVLSCSTYVKKRLPVKVMTNASCPFQQDICKSNDRNLLLDTGYLDSHEDFGLNSPPNQRFKYRNVLHCAPLVTTGRTSTWNLSSDRSYTRYDYGPAVLQPGNFTYQYSNDFLWESAQTRFTAAATDYDIGSVLGSETLKDIH